MVPAAVVVVGMPVKVLCSATRCCPEWLSVSWIVRLSPALRATVAVSSTTSFWVGLLLAGTVVVIAMIWPLLSVSGTVSVSLILQLAGALPEQLMGMLAIRCLTRAGRTFGARWSGWVDAFRKAVVTLLLSRVALPALALGSSGSSAGAGRHCVLDS